MIIGGNPRGYPKVQVFVTKGYQFRARIRESVGQPWYEVTIGGQEWGKGKGREHEPRIRAQMEYALDCLVEHFNEEAVAPDDHYAVRCGGGGRSSG